MVLPSAKRAELEASLGLDTEELMTELLPHVKLAAWPAVSQFFVGAVGLGGSGDLHFGANVEFPGAGAAQRPLIPPLCRLPVAAALARSRVGIVAFAV